MNTASFPASLHNLAIISLFVAALCAVTIAMDEFRRPQRMWIMNLVWPLTALFGSALWLTGYFLWGRASSSSGGEEHKPPFPVMVVKGSSHCGAGCTLGDIIAEWAAFAFPAIAMWFGWRGVFSDKIFAIWIPDFILAFGIGVAFL